MARHRPATRARALLFILTLLGAFLVGTLAEAPTSRAVPGDAVTLYFFWGEGCPHCAAAKPALAELQDRYPTLQIRDFEVRGSVENLQRFMEMAAKFGFEPTGVPTFFLGERYWVGFDERTTGQELESAIVKCLETGCPDAGAGVVAPAAPVTGESQVPRPPTGDVVHLPILGDVDAGSQSLVLTTVLVAAVDGFNPCSLWVLSILLALTLRTGSRRTIAVIGLVYIFVTALVYALFIAGMFSIVSVLSLALPVRIIVAVVALTFGAVNIKDYFWFKKGVSLTIPESRKPGIYRRMRDVIAVADSMPALIAATAVLAAGVSFVELACTAGFPVLWTNIVSAREVSAAVFFALLALYMLVYQLDELAIFGAAVITLRATKLEEKQGRLLKLIGGVLMVSLAVVMMVNPSLMNSIGTSVLVFAAAAGATLVVVLVHRLVRYRVGRRTP